MVLSTPAHARECASIVGAMDAEERNAVVFGDVITECKSGQWVCEVVGDHEDSRSFASREEAVAQGRRQAAERGTRHIVIDTPPTGDITDQQGGEEA